LEVTDSIMTGTMSTRLVAAVMGEKASGEWQLEKNLNNACRTARRNAPQQRRPNAAHVPDDRDQLRANARVCSGQVVPERCGGAHGKLGPWDGTILVWPVVKAG
jgi:hypothetical protein